MAQRNVWGHLRRRRRKVQPGFADCATPRAKAFAAGLIVALATGPVVAQDVELEEIVVTGSRIARLDFQSASPIVTIAEERFEQTAAATVESVLNTMPQFVGSWGSGSNNPGVGGQARASLRGLNNTATLVLIDGRRMIPAGGDGVPDLNLIPPALIERVEVLTGGASAVYGSDALAGVVNFRLMDEYGGLEFAGDWAGTGYGDAQTYTASVTAGTNFADRRGSIMGFVGYSKRDLVTDADRKFSRVALGYFPGAGGVGPHGDFLPLGSPSILEGRAVFYPSPSAFDALFEEYGYAAGSVPYQRSFGFNSDGTLFSQGNEVDEGSVANFRGVKDPLTYNDRLYTYNYAPTNALQLPLERASLFLSGGFEFNESVELYAQGLYADYSVNQQLAPTPVTEVYFPVTNPYIPPDLKYLLDSRTDPAARVQFGKRILELGPRISENGYIAYQATLGLRGSVFSSWEYNTYIQYGKTEQTSFSTGNVRVSKFEELLYAPDGGKAACGGLNPFGLNSISRECAEYIAVDMTDRFEYRQWTAEFSLSGAPFELPAGSVETVLGLFYKDDSYSQRPDPAAGVILPDGRSDISGYLAGYSRMDATDHNLDVYVEALVPLLADVRGAESLQTVLGYRYSDYASAGGVSSYKAELLYRPVAPVRLRGSYQHAVRAPSLWELYDPRLPGDVFLYFPDPCSVGSDQRTGPDAAQVEALCLAQGIPADVLSTYENWDNFVEGFYGGNPDLEPERATTYTVGLVLNSPVAHPVLTNTQLSVDWYDIAISDAIRWVGASRFVPSCYDPKYNPDFDVANEYCGWFSRDPETGVIVDAYAIQRNIASVQVSGIDLQLDWRMAAGPGEVGATWLVGWMDDFLRKTDPKVKADQWVNKGCCPTLPQWKWNLDLRYTVGGLTASAVWTYLGKFDSYFETDFEIPSTSYFDVVLAYEFDVGSLKGLTLRAGITNLTDEQPPIFPDYEQANTDPSVFDVIGRRYWVSVNYAIRPGSE